MRIAVPVLDDVFCEHFGRSSGFFLCDVDEATHQLGRTRIVVRPRGKGRCESLPDWLAQMGDTTLLVGGIGEVGRHNFQRMGIAVSTGHSYREPDKLIVGYLAGSARPETNPCAGYEHRHHHCRSGSATDRR